MASDHDDDSDIAPSEFPICSSDDDLDKAPLVAHLCPLCRSPKKHFYCCDCVRNGDFYSSHCLRRESSQRFVEKKLALLRVKADIQEILSSAHDQLKKNNELQSLSQRVRSTRERIEMLKQWKEEVKRSLTASQLALEEVRQQKCEEHKVLARLKSETLTFQQRATDNTHQMEHMSQQLQRTYSQLKQLVKENVEQTLCCIFPITCEGQPGSEEDSESLANVKDALADASQTAYVRGQWVYADAGHSGRYRIAGVMLPGAGDMAAYQLCVDQAEKDGDGEMVRHFKVALSHATQVTHLLAFYFGVRLPKRVNHLDFERSDLNTRRFATKIARLHANVLFLCASQGVAPVHLRHTNPLARLSTLLEKNICDLGRFGPIEFHPELWSFEEVGEEGEATMSQSSSDEEDSDPLNADWESVASLSPATDSPSGGSSNNRTSQTMSGTNAETDTANTGSVVGGVVSSVASLWSKWPWAK